MAEAAHEPDSLSQRGFATVRGRKDDLCMVYQLEIRVGGL